MFFLLSLYVVFEALCRHSGLMFLWPPPDAVQRSDSFQSRDICVCCLVTNGDRCGGRWNHGNHFRGKVQRDWQPGASQTEWGARRVLFLAFDPFFFLFFSEGEADHAEVAELWSIGEGVEEMGEFLYFLHLEGDKEARKLQTLWEMRINVSKNSISICARYLLFFFMPKLGNKILNNRRLHVSRGHLVEKNKRFDCWHYSFLPFCVVTFKAAIPDLCVLWPIDIPDIFPLCPHILPYNKIYPEKTQTRF